MFQFHVEPVNDLLQLWSYSLLHYIKFHYMVPHGDSELSTGDHISVISSDVIYLSSLGWRVYNRPPVKHRNKLVSHVITYFYWGTQQLSYKYIIGVYKQILSRCSIMSDIVKAWIIYNLKSPMTNKQQFSLGVLCLQTQSRPLTLWHILLSPRLVH